MRTALLLHVFTGDATPGWRNRQSNEIIFTAQNAAGYSVRAVVPGAINVQLLSPASRALVVTAVTRDGEVFHAQLARYDDEAPIHSGLYLASVSATVFEAPSDDYTGTALASILIDEDLPVVPRPRDGEARNLTDEERQSLQPAIEQIESGYDALHDRLAALRGSEGSACARCSCRGFVPPTRPARSPQKCDRCGHTSPWHNQ